MYQLFRIGLYRRLDGKVILFYSPEEIVASSVDDNTIRGIVDKLYMVDMLCYTEISDGGGNWVRNIQ
jgi:hypothetical protein